MNFKRTRIIAVALTLPLAGAKAILISTNTALSPGDTTFEGADLIVSNCTLTAERRAQLCVAAAHQRRRAHSLACAGRRAG